MELDAAFESAFAGIREQMLSDLISEKANEQGHTLTKRQLRALVADLLSGSSEGRLKGRRSQRKAELLTLEFSPEDLEALERKQARLFEAIPDIVEKALMEMSQKFEASLTRTFPAERRLNVRRAREVERAIRRKWGRALDELENLLTLAEHLSASCSGSSNRDARGEAVLGLTARSCRIGAEILTLLRSGFAECALARWRSLYEHAVVCEFLGTADVSVAEAYLLHAHVEECAELELYEKYRDRLGIEPEPPCDVERVIVDTIVAGYGNGFRRDYGWAADALREKIPGFKKNPTFKDIEAVVGDTEHLRAVFRTACRHVHAGSASRRELVEHLDDNKFPTEPSAAGIAFPLEVAGLTIARAAANLNALWSMSEGTFLTYAVVKSLDRLKLAIAESADNE